MPRVPKARVTLVPRAPGPRTPQTPAVRRYRLTREPDLLDLMMGPELLGPQADDQARDEPLSRRPGRSSGGS